MTDKRKRQKLSRADRVSRAERNERRGRDSKAVAWTKQHVVKDKPKPFGELPKTKAQRAAERFAEDLRNRVPAIEDARGGK